ncbi:hypothetical protein [Mesorhizobium sp. M1322]|uniref:hypothetical protein n=1 Tax=Mesorhizobium sp. M1322 TaxID=2957081 RepID=UPI00333AE1D5
MDQTTANVLTDLLRELSSELDLHHDDAHLRVCKSTIKSMRRAAKMMEEAGYPAPDAYHHVLSRFERVTRP